MPVKQTNEKQKKNYINFSFFLGISFSVCITYLLAIINNNKQKSITRGGGSNDIVLVLKQNINDFFDLNKQYQKKKEEEQYDEIKRHFDFKVHILKLQNLQQNIDYFYVKDKKGDILIEDGSPLYDFNKFEIAEQDRPFVKEKLDLLRNISTITEDSYNTTIELQDPTFNAFVNEMYTRFIKF